MANPSGVDTVEIRNKGAASWNDLGRIVSDGTDGLDPEMLEDTEDTHGTPLHAGQAQEPTVQFDPSTTSGVTLSGLTTDMENDQQKEIRITYLSGKSVTITGYLFGVIPVSNPGVGPAQLGQFSIREVRASGGFIPS